ncbi:Glycosyl transferase [Aphelenchoides avenae]|nr:Glycosyl transferase [Aphelenchus avenae]
MMQWQQTFCPQAAFWLKTDDDTTVHVARLLHHIERRFKPEMYGTKAIFCLVIPPNPVHRNRTNKWYVSRELFADKVYPPFCTGYSYLVSRDAVATILFGARFVKAFHTEDALYTGVIAASMGIPRSTHAEVFTLYDGLLQNVTKCDDTGVPLSSAVFSDDTDPARLQADTFSLMKNQRCR